MDDITRSLVNQHIREYDMRLRRIDELLGQAEKEMVRHPKQIETSAQLENLKQERDKLAGWLEEIRLRPLENWEENAIRQAGPMGVWDAVAQQLEKLIEHIER